MSGNGHNTRGHENGPASNEIQHSLQEEDLEVSPLAVGDFSTPCFDNGNSSTPVSQLVIPGLDPSVYIDEETQMNFEGALESPREIMSPADHGDASSPMEAMESDGIDESAVSDRNENSYRRHLPPDHAQILSTTTPGGSSDTDDPYSSNKCQKKRRRTHRRVQHGALSQWNFTKYQSPASSQVPSPAPSNEAWLNETGEDSSACPTPFYNRQRNPSQPNVLSNNSDSNLHTAFSRRLSNTSTEQTPNSRLVKLQAKCLNSKIENRYSCHTVSGITA